MDDRWNAESTRAIKYIHQIGLSPARSARHQDKRQKQEAIEDPKIMKGHRLRLLGVDWEKHHHAGGEKGLQTTFRPQLAKEPPEKNRR